MTVTEGGVNSTLYTIDSGQSDMNACSLVVDSNNDLHAAWSSKNSSRPNSFNIRYSKGINGGTVWTTPKQVTTFNNTSYSITKPVIIIKNNSYPSIIFEYKNGSSTSININNYTSSGWDNTYYGSGINIGTGYNPCAIIDGNGYLHVTWQNSGIYYKKSTNNGDTWLSLQSIINDSTQNTSPTIAFENNNIYIIWARTYPNTYYNIAKSISRNGGDSWGNVEMVTSNANHTQCPQLMNTGFSYIGYIYQNSQMNAVNFDAIVINNAAPIVDASNINAAPKENDILTEQEISYVPTIIVSDNDDETLICKYYFDSELIPRETIIANNNSRVDFTPVNISNLNEGDHVIRFTVCDGLQITEQIINFKVDKTPPIIDSFTVTSNVNNITVCGTASDAVSSLDTAPYRFTIYNAGSMELIGDSGWTTDTSYSISELTGGTLYIAKFEAKDKAGHITTNTMNISTSIDDPILDEIDVNEITDKSIPLKISDTNPTYTYYQIIASSDQYDRDVKYVSSFGTLSEEEKWITIPTKKIEINGLLPNKEYSFKIKAKSLTGQETAESPVVSATTLDKVPSVPTNIKFSATDVTITLTWDTADYATGYEVLKDEVQTIDNGNELTYADNVNQMSQHVYRVRTLNNNAHSEWSNPIVVTSLPTKPLPPTISITDIYATEITVTWNTVDNNNYDIEVDGRIINNKASNSYTHLNLNPQSQHTYRVRSKFMGMLSEWSNYTRLITNELQAIQDVPALQVKEVSNKSITLTWDRIPDATDYEVEVDLNIRECKNIFFAQYNLEPNSIHTYRVRAKNSLGAGNWSNLETITTYNLNTPVNVTTEPDVTSITLTWDEVENATGYDLKIGQNIIDAGLNTSYIHDSLTPESSFVYSVRAKNIDGTSAWSNNVYSSTLPMKLDAPANVSAYAYQDKITLLWDEVLNAEGYDVELDGTVISNGNNLEYVDTLLDKNSIHTYRVRPKNSAVEGYWSSPITVTTLPDFPESPKNLTVRNDGSIAVISWDCVDAAKNYSLVIDGDGDGDGQNDGTIMNTGTSTSYTQRRVELNNEHTYMVRSTNVIGESEWSNKVISNSLIAVGNKTEDLDLGLTASDIQDFSRYVLKVTYDKNVLDVTDLSITTPAVELTTGKIEGTDIEITSFEPGEIIFVVDKYINPGESWTGIINNIRFKAKASGEVTLNYLVEELR